MWLLVRTFPFYPSDLASGWRSTCESPVNPVVAGSVCLCVAAWISATRPSTCPVGAAAGWPGSKGEHLDA